VFTDKCIQVSVQMPAPVFTGPTPLEGEVLRTAQFCPLLQLLKVSDANGFRVEMLMLSSCFTHALLML
jgi:hypothetical protein